MNLGTRRMFIGLIDIAVSIVLGYYTIELWETNPYHSAWYKVWIVLRTAFTGLLAIGMLIAGVALVEKSLKDD